MSKFWHESSSVDVGTRDVKIHLVPLYCTGTLNSSSISMCSSLSKNQIFKEVKAIESDMVRVDKAMLHLFAIVQQLMK